MFAPHETSSATLFFQGSIGSSMERLPDIASPTKKEIDKIDPKFLLNQM